MTLRIGEVIARGEIYNTQRNSVHGWLALRGSDRRVALHLTGNCGADLAGRHVRFEARDAWDGAPEDLDDAELAAQQIGPTGAMTAARTVQVPDCGPEELAGYQQRGDPPPMRSSRCLYLEWFSQDGRVVLELVDPRIEFVDDGPEQAVGDASVEDSDDADDRLLAEGSRPADESLELWPDGDEEDDFEDEDEDPYHLFPADLHAQLGSGDESADQLLSGVDDETLRHWEMMDEIFEGQKDVPIASLFDPPIKLYPPDRLKDDQVEGAVKDILSRLARHGIALDMCEHFTFRDAYRLLLERILREEQGIPELPATGYVQHFMTHDFCDACAAEMEAELREYERRRGEDDAGGDDLPDEDVPF